MKTVIFLFAMLFSLSIYAQETTQSEYDWIDAGCPVPSHIDGEYHDGYTLKNIGTWGYTHSNLMSSTDREFSFQTVYRKGVNKPIAILVTYIKGGNSENTYCIPTKGADQSLWDETYKEISKVDAPDEMYRALIYALMHLASDKIE